MRGRVATLGALLLFAGCAPHKTLERHELRTDTFRALLAEQLTVSLDDVVILPRDSVRPAVAARRATIRRTASTRVDAKSETAKSEAASSTPPEPRRRSPLWFLLAAAAAVFLWLSRRPCKR